MTQGGYKMKFTWMFIALTSSGMMYSIMVIWAIYYLSDYFCFLD